MFLVSQDVRGKDLSGLILPQTQPRGDQSGPPYCLLLASHRQIRQMAEKLQDTIRSHQVQDRLQGGARIDGRHGGCSDQGTS